MKLFFGDKTELTNNALLRKAPDLFYILLLMYISHRLLGHHIIGLAIGLMTASWQHAAIYAIAKGVIYKSKEVKAAKNILTAVASVTGGAVLLWRERLMQQPDSLVLIFLASVIMFKNIICVLISTKKEHSKLLLTVIHMVSGLLFVTVCAAFVRTSALSAILFYIPIALFEYIRDMKHQQAPLENNDENISSISSYRLFSQMSLYVSISFYLSIFTYIGYVLTINIDNIDIYIGLLLGILLVSLVCFVCYRAIRTIPARQSLPMFIGGTVLWGLSIYNLFRVSEITGFVVFSVMLGIGVCFMYVALYRQNEAFKQVSCIIDQDISTDRLMQATDITQSLGFIISALITTIIIIIRTCFISDQTDSTVFSVSTLLLPFVFTVLSIIMCLKQPFDASALDKLESVKRGEHEDEMKQYLHNILIKKYRKRYGVRIIAFFIKPFIYHKVYGKENVTSNTLPAVFVCNHGEIYGPITAVTHLPYYFRPWTHADMLSYQSAKERIYNGTIKPLKIPEFLKKPITCIFARLSTWALNSFDPVPVYLESIRTVYKTMQASVLTLAQGDSLLIFPENPASEQDGKYVTGGVSTLYTGFAQLGIEYYKKYGKSITFYPVYSSKAKRTFRIGKGISFNSDNNRHDEKLRIAQELERSMKELSLL